MHPTEQNELLDHAISAARRLRGELQRQHAELIAAVPEYAAGAPVMSGVIEAIENVLAALPADVTDKTDQDGRIFP